MYCIKYRDGNNLNNNTIFALYDNYEDAVTALNKNYYGVDREKLIIAFKENDNANEAIGLFNEVLNAFSKAALDLDPADLCKFDGYIVFNKDLDKLIRIKQLMLQGGNI